mmetsp:Transcript_30527/g.69923  ORF Transcript_30527/g.69923 Transcript_30527/m.69923 type:complete len:224 (+) Transcript_30527:459-1130(+)
MVTRSSQRWVKQGASPRRRHSRGRQQLRALLRPCARSFVCSSTSVPPPGMRRPVRPKARPLRPGAARASERSARRCVLPVPRARSSARTRASSSLRGRQGCRGRRVTAHCTRPHAPPQRRWSRSSSPPARRLPTSTTTARALYITPRARARRRASWTPLPRPRAPAAVRSPGGAGQAGAAGARGGRGSRPRRGRRGRAGRQRAGQVGAQPATLGRRPRACARR